MKFFRLLTATAVVLNMVSIANAAKPNVNAPKGGTLYYNLDNEPESLHPIMAGDAYEAYVAAYTHDSLCYNDIETYEFKPGVAEKWDISPDGLVYTFHLRKNGFFHNGDPITADDVKASYEAIKEPKHQALNLLSYIELITKVEVLDQYTIKFTTKEKYFKTLGNLCGIIKVLPKSVYGDVNKSIKLQKEVVGAGPYKLEKYDKGQGIVLKKFDKWYGWSVPEFKGFNNFDQIIFKFTKDDNILVEKFKKGDLDYAELLSPEAYMKMIGKPFKAKYDGGKFLAFSVVNEMPKSYGYIGFNFKDPILADKNVRLAIAHLVNRAEMNKKFYDNLRDLATGPVSVKSKQAASVKPFDFNPSTAKDLLKKAGWGDTDKNGILDKVIDGQKKELKFSFIYANKNNEKLWTIIKEDCKKAGIEIELKYLEWNTFIKNVDDRSQQLWAMGWGGGDVEMDPKQIWHSTSSGKGGSNYGTYANPEVDKLIDEGRSELDSAKRTKIFKKAYTLIAEDVPYIFLFNNKYDHYVRSKKVQSAVDTFKYSFGVPTWWSTK